MTEVDGAARQEQGGGQPGDRTATIHASGFRLGWKETLFRIGSIIVLGLFTWICVYAALYDPEFLRPDIGAWEAGIRRAVWWSGAILFSGAATFLVVQLLATALSGRKALGFIPWLSGPQMSGVASEVRH